MSANAANTPPGADVSIESMLDIRQQNWRQRVAGAQSFWVTIALLVICVVMSFLQPASFATPGLSPRSTTTPARMSSHRTRSTGSCQMSTST